jgi:hypothetical protein
VHNRLYFSRRRWTADPDGSPHPPLAGATPIQTDFPAATAGPSTPTGRSFRRPRPGNARHQRPAPGFGPISVHNGQSRLFLSTWTDGRSRRLSAPATRWSDSDPNGLPGGHRWVSHTHRKLPHLHGGSFASLGRGTLLGAQRPGFFGPTPQPAVSLSKGGRTFPAALRAATLWSKPGPGGVVGGRRGTPPGAPCLPCLRLTARQHMKLHITLSSSLYPRSRRYRLEKSTHETRSKVEDFERSSWSEGRTLRWFSVRSGTKTARRVGADLGVWQGGSGPLGVGSGCAARGRGSPRVAEAAGGEWCAKGGRGLKN